MKGRKTPSVVEYREMIRAFCRTRSQIDWGKNISGYHDVEDIGSSRWVVRDGDGDVRPKEQTEVPVGVVTQELPLVALSHEIQATCLALSSTAYKTGYPPPKQESRSTLISGREGEKYAARIFTGLSASSVCMEVASTWVSLGASTEL
jgi:hypothetical protein